MKQHRPDHPEDSEERDTLSSESGFILYSPPTTRGKSVSLSCKESCAFSCADVSRDRSKVLTKASDEISLYVVP